MSAVVTDGEDASPDVVTQQALVRKAVDWQIWPLRGATFIPAETPEEYGGHGGPVEQWGVEQQG